MRVSQKFFYIAQKDIAARRVSLTRVRSPCYHQPTPNFRFARDSIQALSRSLGGGDKSLVSCYVAEPSFRK
jgi:hypothetical protein